MTPAISALEIRHYPHQDNVSETGSASRPPQQHGDGYISWSKADGLLSHRTLTVPVGHRGPGDNSEEIIRRLSHSSAGSEVNTIRSASSISMFDDNDMVQYSLEARIIQKKDQLEELSATGAIIPTPIVEEVRTGQQFLIKIHLSKNSSSLPSRFPALRVGRREAINTAGEARSEPEPLTLEIAVHLAKSGQTRKGACAKCCHKYGPSSPILVLLDPLSPSVTDPVNYAHIDTTSGSITMLAKVLCSSTDHGERGNKDRYIFEFRLKSTSSMPLIPSSTLSTSDASSRASEAPEDEGDTVSSCFTQPIMCSGHHKAKRVYPHQRPIKTPKGVPTPKTKTIKRHKSVPTITMPHQGGSHSMTGETSSSSDHLVDSVGPMSGHSGFSSNMSFLSGPLSQLSDYSHHPHHQHHQHLNDINSRSHILDNQGQPLLSTSSTTINNNSNNPNSTTTTANSTHGLQDPLQHSQSQCPRITEVRPSHGPIRKTTDVVLRGLAFREGMVPYFGCFPALDIIVETANLMVCKAPESPLPGTVGISIYDHLGNSFSDLGQFTYTDDSETELLILQLQLRLAHRALEYMHTRATGQKGNAADILREIPGLATSPRSGSVLMMDAREGLTEATEATEAIVVDGGVDEDMPLMTLAQIEESIMNTLDNVPRGMDISVQLDDGTNMLHLAILLGFNYLAVRLIEEGCDLEALDAWSMTPLMYTVLKGNEAIARILVIAGASSSGASTPQEFYARLPRQVEPTQAMYNFLSVSCTRFSGSPRLYTLESATFDSEMAAVEEQDDEEEEWTETSSDSSIETVPIARSVVTPPLIKAEDESSASTLASPEATIGPSEGGAGQKQLTDLASTIQGVRVTPFMPPLDQQDLPPLQKVEEDGSVTINSKVVQGAEIYGGHGAELFRNVNPESGYHSGVYSEVQEQLNRLHLTTLPSEGVQMSVSLKKLTPSSSSATRRQQSSSTVISAMPLELFRTGDSFGVEIKLGSSDAQVPMPKECLGLRFPHEMVKRVSGRPASILTEMTYILRATVELGKTSMALTPEQSSSAAEERGHGHEQEEHYGDGIPLIGSCQACSKFLHEHKKLSPSRRSQTDPSVYPVLQFSIPGGPSTNPTTTATTTTTTAMAAAAAVSSAGVVELRDGVCEIKAKVNCSSLHHLIQRERARRIAELKRRQQEAVASVTSTTCATESSSTNTTTTATSTTKTKKSSLAMTDLQDPGFVFKFEVVHPTLGTVVARCETKPILFQSYSRGREGK
ncbi:SPT3 Dosage dependent suppressor of Ty-induced promoter mutations-like protein [Mortierella sp. GBA35]|nr:SPT3 Dosage dependent suppressor of Ty-induced promoter mutations-like protein [Mortierella sp. GBA35]